METHDARDVLAEIVATLAAGLAMAAGLRAVHGHRIACLEPRHALADRRDLARRLDAHRLRHLALGERHAAKAPDVEIIERQRPHPHLNFAWPGRRRGVDLGDAKIAVAEELKGSAWVFPLKRRSRSGPEDPPWTSARSTGGRSNPAATK